MRDRNSPGRVLCGVLALAALGAAGLAAPRAAPAVLGVANRHNEGAWIAADGSFVAVAWAAQEQGDNPDVFVATSRDGGVAFGEPVRVNREPGEAYVSGELPPRVAIVPSSSGGTPEVVVAWSARLANTEIRLARSRDGGKTFAQPISLQAKDAPGDRGWHALALDRRGQAHVVWLDHRGLAEDWEAPASGPAPSNQKPPDEFAESMAMAARSGIYHRAADRPGAEERLLATSVCYCCKTALAAGPNETLYAAWRHVYPGSIRDIAFAASSDGGRTFRAPGRVSKDNWQLDGCPDDGPGIAVGSDGGIHVVWPTVIDGTEPQGAIFYARSADGHSFGPRIRVPTLGSPRPTHPVVALDGRGRAVIAWDEMQGSSRKVIARTVALDAQGRPTFGPPAVLGVGASASYPALALTARGVVVAWSDGIAPTGRIAVAPID